MILHTLSSSPRASDSLQQCLRYSREGDALLLLDDSVYALLEKTLIPSGLGVYVCESDLLVRGIDPRKVFEAEINTGDDSLPHTLAAQADKVIHWG